MCCQLKEKLPVCSQREAKPTERPRRSEPAAQASRLQKRTKLFRGLILTPRWRNLRFHPREFRTCERGRLSLHAQSWTRFSFTVNQLFFLWKCVVYFFRACVPLLLFSQSTTFGNMSTAAIYLEERINKVHSLPPDLFYDTNVFLTWCIFFVV